MQQMDVRSQYSADHVTRLKGLTDVSVLTATGSQYSGSNGKSSFFP